MTRSSTPTWTLILRSDVEVTGVELVGGTNLGRDRGKWMEHGHDEGRRECGSELASGGGAGDAERFGSRFPFLSL